MTTPAERVTSGTPARRSGARAADPVLPRAFREIDLPRPRILPATDLGTVETLKHGTIFLLSDALGDTVPDSRGLGLYANDTRIVSRAEMRVNGVRPALLQSNTGANYQGTIQLTNPDFLHAPAPDGIGGLRLGRHALGIERGRSLAGGFRERIRVVNYTATPETVDLTLDLAADCADIFEVRGYPRPRRGETLPAAVSDDRLTFRYAGLDGVERRTCIAFSGPVEIELVAAADGDAALRAAWRWTIPPGESRQLEWRAWLVTCPASAEAAVSAPDRAVVPRQAAADLFPDPPAVSPDAGSAAYRAWASGTTAVDSDHETFNLTVARSLRDLRLLLNDGPEPGERHIAAGVPWFATLFGRDSIIASLQLLAFRPQLAVETLLVLAARQATTHDDWRDAEPGKILHELRSTEMTASGELPFGRYYGSIDATPLWLILLGATFDWTGDAALVDRLWPNALAALEWLDRWGDADGDGFIEYAGRSESGLVNQGWKDSGDAVRDRRGALAAAPIRLAEVQGYAYDARVRLARLARFRGDEGLARDLETRAARLREDFERRFWLDDAGYYALAIDGQDRLADSITSNPGHCLWSGIVGADRARRVADRLLDPALFSGWGVRTYAANQPGYNPIGYHTGSVWPHDTAIAAAGLKRYGFHEEANRLIGALFEAAEHFPAYRLPELFCGFDRATTEIPISYPVACSPQAWAAGATYQLLQTMLGLEAHADRRELILRAPVLPSWLSRVTLTNVRVGDAAVDLLFHRWRGTTSAEVLRKVGDVSVAILL